jgi:hypothetical protein
MAVNTAQVEALASTLSKNLPKLLKIGTSMQGRFEGAAKDARASISGMKATLEAAGTDALQVGSCFVASLEAQAQASARIQVSVQASAQVSAKASGSAKSQ